MLYSGQQLLKIQFSSLTSADRTRSTNALAWFVSFICEVLNPLRNIGSVNLKSASANCWIYSIGANIVSWGRTSWNKDFSTIIFCFYLPYYAVRWWEISLFDLRSKNRDTAALQLIESERWGTANAHIFQSVISTYNSLQTDCVEIQLTLSAKILVLANNGLYKDINGCVLDFCIWYRTFHCTNNAGDEEFWK